jgi:hypothetical protein
MKGVYGSHHLDGKAIWNDLIWQILLQKIKKSAMKLMKEWVILHFASKSMGSGSRQWGTKCPVCIWISLLCALLDETLLQGMPHNYQWYLSLQCPQ